MTGVSDSPDDLLAAAFEENRTRLRSVAYRILGSDSEAEDAVQEAWIRLNRSEADRIDNLGGWLTTVVSRVCLDLLRSRRSRREASLDDRPVDAPDEAAIDPAERAVEVDAMGAALMVVLDTLNPAERLAFVLHDLFGVSFDEIATIVDRTPAAARQLASRARRRVRGESVPVDQERQREIVTAFFEATRNGEFERLLTLLDPDVVLRADPTAVARTKSHRAHGAPRVEAELRGADAVANALSGTAQGARIALVDGRYGAAWAPDGTPRSVFELTVRDGKVVSIELYADPELVDSFDIRFVD